MGISLGHIQYYRKGMRMFRKWIPKFLKLSTTTRPFVNKDDKKIEDSIAEQRYLLLGGVKQWTLLRGRSIHNPILIFLHGGPGMSEHGFFRYCNSELENHFLVVGWDQRGTGKSYCKNIDLESMKIDQFITDLHELVTYLKQRFAQEKVYLVCKSWGTLLGTLYCSKYPRDIAAYVGIGQISDIQKSERLSYQFTLGEAKKRKNNKALKDLQSINGASGSDIEDVRKQRKWLVKFGGHVYGHSSLLRYFIPKLLSVDEYSWADIIRLKLGSKISTNALWSEIFDVNFFEQVPSLDVPTYFFLGRHDYCVPSALAAEYFEYLRAPFKKLIWFENSGHNPPFEEPERFNEIMISLKGEG